MCGTTRQLGSLHEGVVGAQGLGVGDVEAGPEEVARAQRVREGLLVDDRSPARVDEDGPALHARQRGGVDEVPRLGREDGVQAHEVGLREDHLEWSIGGAELLLHVPARRA